MSEEIPLIEKTSSKKLSVKTLSEKEVVKEENDSKNFFLRDVDISFVKEALLKELDIAKIKDTLVDDIKATLLKEIDVSGIKEALLKDIAVKDFIGGNVSSKISEVSSDEKPQEKKKSSVNLPAYKYGLIDGLVKDHQEILSVYGMIMSNANNKDYTTLPLMLSQFSKKCHDHFSEEEELYMFMEMLAGSRSKVERRVAKEFSVEMKNLSIELFTTLNQSPFIPVNDNTVSGFIDEFSQLGAILQERISREEAVLYPMYENSRQVVDIC